MATVIEKSVRTDGPRFVLWGVDWNTYATLRANLGDRQIRLTYDGENLELMSPSRFHEVVKSLLGRFIEFLSLELDFPISCGGSTTFQREDLLRALEPDECYWIANEPAVRGRRELDFNVDPPPDLAIDIEISRGSLDRMKIYSRLGVPEIWKYNGDEVRVMLLQPDGKYAASEASVCLPFLSIQEISRFLEIAEQQDETACMKAFVQWVRQQNFQFP